MNIREPIEPFIKTEPSSKNPEISLTRKQNGSSNEGKFARKPASNETHRRKGMNTNKNTQIELLQSNVLSSLKSDLQHLQSQMLKLNGDGEFKGVIYAKTVSNTNNTEEQPQDPTLCSDPRTGLSISETKSLSNFQPAKKGFKPLSLQQPPKILLTSEFKEPKEGDKWKDRLKQFHFQEEMRSKNAIINELERRLECVKQNYQNQLTQVIQEKMQMEKGLRGRVEELMSDRSRKRSQSVVLASKEQEISDLKQELSKTIKLLQQSQAEKMELKRTHEGSLVHYEREISALRLCLSQYTEERIMQKQKSSSPRRLRNQGKKPGEFPNQSAELNNEHQFQECQACINNQQMYQKYMALTEQNQQLRASIQSFLKQLKAQNQQPAKILNPQLQHQISKNNILIETLTSKVKQIDTLALQLHSIDKKYKTLEYLLQQNNQELFRVGLKTLNSFYK